MTQQNKEKSAFNERADNAARALKGDLSKKFGIQIPEKQVELDESGKPPPPLPPEGSYARMALEAQKAEEEKARIAQAIQEEEPEGQATEAPQPETPAPQAEEQQQLTDNAQSRIRDLVAQLKSKDSELESLRKAQSESTQTLAELKASQEAMQQQYQQIVDQNLDALDPETRAMVMADARIREAVERSNAKLLQSLTPRLERFERMQEQQEMDRLADRYPGYNAEIHPALIDAFRDKNPNCSVEQAFRAVARPEELLPKQKPASPVPPSIAPGASAPKYSQPEPERNPEAELQEMLVQAAKLRRSSDPVERREGLKAFDQIMRQRLFGNR